MVLSISRVGAGVSRVNPVRGNLSPPAAPAPSFVRSASKRGCGRELGGCAAQGAAAAEWLQIPLTPQRLAGAVYVADLPRNPNGKILKRELRKQYADWEKAR